MIMNTRNISAFYWMPIKFQHKIYKWILDRKTKVGSNEYEEYFGDSILIYLTKQLKPYGIAVIFV